MSVFSEWTPPALARVIRRYHRDFFCGGFVGLDGLDRRLVAAIHPWSGGYFVELGAYDGVTQSNTYVLQLRYGWTGLLVEPSPLRFEECVRNRDFGVRPHVRCAACVPHDFAESSVTLLEAGPMSVALGLEIPGAVAHGHAQVGASVMPSGHLPYAYAAIAKPLTHLLDEANAPARIDLLSLDVEGNESAVLRGIDFTRYSFRWILIETRADATAEQLLLDNGYSLITALAVSDERKDVLFGLPTNRV